MSTGNVIKRLRTTNNMTQEQLGELLGVKKAAIQKYENGSIVNLKVDTIRKLCEIFKVMPYVFIFGTDEPEFNNSNSLYAQVKLVETLESLFGKDYVELLTAYSKLNNEGKEKVFDYVEDISNLDYYKEYE